MSAETLPVKGLLSTVYHIFMDRDLKLPLDYQRVWELDFSGNLEITMRFCVVYF